MLLTLGLPSSQGNLEAEMAAAKKAEEAAKKAAEEEAAAAAAAQAEADAAAAKKVLFCSLRGCSSVACPPMPAGVP